MKLTLEEKRDVVEKFRGGESIVWLAYVYVCKESGSVGVWQQREIAAVIRDFMNGKFKLKPARRGGR